TRPQAPSRASATSPSCGTIRSRNAELAGRLGVMTAADNAMGSPIRLVIADDQALFREGLRTLLSVHPAIAGVGGAAGGSPAVREVVQRAADVVLMDLRMPVLDGVGATRRIAASSRCRVIALTTFDDDESVFEALRAGAVGYLLKDVASERLVEAIRLAARGE